ncbi:MAG: hypothetical protein RR225_07620 [Clostridium sp.]
MRKQKLLLIAFMCMIAFSGCKKKEPIDLSSLHTTAAIEKETISSTTEADTTAASAQESTSSGDKTSGSNYSIKAEIKSYKKDNIAIEYPEVSNMKDADKQKQVNEMLKNNALAIADALSVGTGQSLTVKSTVESSNLKRLSVTYKGDLKDTGSTKTTRIFYTNTINLESVQNLRLSDYTDTYTVAGYIASGDYQLEPGYSGDEKAIRAYINASDKTTDYYYKKLETSDFSTSATWPEYFSYEKQGNIFIRIPLSAELGDYAIIKYSPDNK